MLLRDSKGTDGDRRKGGRTGCSMDPSPHRGQEGVHKRGGEGTQTVKVVTNRNKGPT